MLMLDASRDGPVSGFSLHVHEHLPSALWVVGSGSLVTSVPPTCARASALDVMDYGLARAGDAATH